MRLWKNLLSGTVGAVLIGSFCVTSPLTTEATDGGMDGHVMTGPTGNKVEMVDPAKSTYVPNIGAATDQERAWAREKLQGVNQFCRSHTAAGIKKNWRPGEGNTAHATHWFNPNKGATGMHPAKPRAALIYDGKLGGVMFTGVPALPHMGSIPRAHAHDMMMSMEMVHVYCTKSLKEAFTPNRVMGVLADTIALRLQIRPAIMNLRPAQLRAVQTLVRGFVGGAQRAVTPTGAPARTGPDPVLQAIRTEIRQSLMVLSEPQLRSVWRLMQSY